MVSTVDKNNNFSFEPITGDDISQQIKRLDINPISANPTKWPNTLKQFVAKLPTNCLSVFGHFVNLVLKGLIKLQKKEIYLQS